MRRPVAWIILLVGTVVGYEFWGVREMGMPPMLPAAQHPLIGSWQEVDDGRLRIVEFRRDHSGNLLISTPDEAAEDLDISFAWTTRRELDDGRNGHLQISFDRADYAGGGGDNISAPCRYSISSEEPARDIVQQASLVLDGNNDCEAFFGEFMSDL